MLAPIVALALLFSCACGQSQNHTLNFVSLGDWGWNGPDQSSVATQLGIAAAKLNATFLLAIGDNFYDDGVANDTDPQWQTTYRDIYTAKSLDIPWYGTLGNHDHHYGRGQAEIDYYKNKRDNRWIMPDYWYNVKMNLTNGGTVEFIFIDTIIWTGISSHLTEQQRVDIRDPASVQRAWYNATIAASTADWLFVVSHYPVYSGGEHGNTPGLADALIPSLTEFGVDFYLCGHDHNLQHLADSPNGVQYFVSGNGAKRGTYAPIKQSLFGAVDPGIMTHEIVNDILTTTLIDHTGKAIYSYKQKRIIKKHERIAAGELAAA